MSTELMSSALDLTTGHDLAPGSARHALAAAGRLRRRRRMAGAGVGATAAVALGAVAVVVPGSSSSPAARQVAAASAPSADRSTVTDAELTAAQWFSVRTRNTQTPTGSPVNQTAWYAHADGNVIVTDPETGVAHRSGEDSFSIGNTHPLTWDQLASAPTDPTTLRSWLTTATPSDIAEKQIFLLLAASPAPLELRRGLSEVLSQLGTVTSGKHDSLGRPATLVVGHYDIHYFVDPLTFHVLEQSAGTSRETFLSWGTDTAPAATPWPQPVASPTEGTEPGALTKS